MPNFFTITDSLEEIKRKDKIRHKTTWRYKNKKKNTCSDCGFNGRTNWHHKTYEVDNIIELCSSCHGKQHGKKNDKRSIRETIVEKMLDYLRERGKL